MGVLMFKLDEMHFILFLILLVWVVAYIGEHGCAKSEKASTPIINQE